MAIEVAVLELYARALREVSSKNLDVDFARPSIGVGFNLPSRADVPAEDHPMRRFEHENPCRSALAPVNAAIVDAALLAARTQSRRSGLGAGCARGA